MRWLASDRSIVRKKADKGSCVVVWNREAYIAEADKQLNDESFYKKLKFKDKILQDIAEKSNDILKGPKTEDKIAEKQLKFLQLNIKKLLIWRECICFPRSTIDCMMFLGDQLY